MLWLINYKSYSYDDDSAMIYMGLIEAETRDLAIEEAKKKMPAYIDKDRIQAIGIGEVKMLDN